jgi:hypothetical protein
MTENTLPPFRVDIPAGFPYILRPYLLSAANAPGGNPP